MLPSASWPRVRVPVMGTVTVRAGFDKDREL